jgi:hypothetical protein
LHTLRGIPRIPAAMEAGMGVKTVAQLVIGEL